MQEWHEEAKAALKRPQEEIKRYADRNRKDIIKATKVEVWSLHFKLQEEPKLYCLDIQEEPKRTEWGLLKTATIISTLQSILI